MPNMTEESGNRDMVLNPEDLRILLELGPVLKRVIPSHLDDEAQYDQAVAILDVLIAKTEGNEDHPLLPIIHTLGTLIHNYETQNPFIEDLEPQEMLRYLMEEHGLTQSDFKVEIGSQGVVSEILNGKRRLNTRQIEALSIRFQVSPAVFYPINLRHPFAQAV